MDHKVRLSQYFIDNYCENEQYGIVYQVKKFIITECSINYEVETKSKKAKQKSYYVLEQFLEKV